MTAGVRGLLGRRGDVVAAATLVVPLLGLSWWLRGDLWLWASAGWMLAWAVGLVVCRYRGAGRR